jgi:hypothetical protein
MVVEAEDDEIEQIVLGQRMDDEHIDHHWGLLMVMLKVAAGMAVI